MNSKYNTELLSDISREDLLDLLDRTYSDGIKISFSGKINARSLARRVRPRVTREMVSYGAGSASQRAQNKLIEGDNLQAMVTLYKERASVDLVIVDPPYNTGNDFRYNDRWESDPNDLAIGEVVAFDDGARRTKWMRFMWPRLQLMREMLKPGGVIVVCIDYRELFRLGQMLDELFGEQNRIAIINWQKAAASRADNKHVSTSTEYVLVYSKNIENATTNLLERQATDNKRYANPDGDPKGLWRECNLTARTHSLKGDFAIQSPFTGRLHYPAGEGAWRDKKSNIIAWLNEWGTPYEERDLADGKSPGLVIKNWNGKDIHHAIKARAENILAKGPWPFIWFGMDGLGRPRRKTYLEDLRKGKITSTYWADEDYEINPVEIGSTSWSYTESGRTNDGSEELSAIVGKGHGFNTVKPQKLFEKIIKLWCPIDGLVLDTFAGSGTSAHAVLSLNAEDGGTRRFILIEQGRPEKSDSFAKTLTAERIKRVITGKWATKKHEPIEAGFTFLRLGSKVDAAALLSMEREELLDAVICSFRGVDTTYSNDLERISGSEGVYQYLIAKNKNNEGIFLVWDGVQNRGRFSESEYEACSAEASRAGLSPNVIHVYAAVYMYQTSGVRFYQIPDRILSDFGLDGTSNHSQTA
jgi:adenine-specific DNA-methyltransferase